MTATSGLLTSISSTTLFPIMNIQNASFVSCSLLFYLHRDWLILQWPLSTTLTIIRKQGDSVLIFILELRLQNFPLFFLTFPFSPYNPISPIFAEITFLNAHAIIYLLKNYCYQKVHVIYRNKTETYRITFLKPPKPSSHSSLYQSPYQSWSFILPTWVYSTVFSNSFSWPSTFPKPTCSPLI